MHAPFAPSSTKRWLNCKGSFALALQIPEPPESEYAASGTAYHGVAARALEEHAAGHPVAIAPLSREDADMLQPYLEYAMRRMKTCSAVWIEQWLQRSVLLYGTPDLLLEFAGEDLLEVVDLKTGAGILVDPEENEQLLTYAFLALEHLHGLGRRLAKVRLTIVQPPDEGNVVKSWDTTSEHVREHGARCEAAIDAALAGSSELVPGSWCRFCKAKPICPRLRGEVIEALSTMPLSLTPVTIGNWLDRVERLDEFTKAVRELGHKIASEALATGHPGIPGWGLKPKRATRSWDDEEEVLKIARRRKIKIYQDKMLSPAMAEKAHPNLPEELRARIVAVSSGTNLVRVANAPTAPVAKSDTKMDRLMANFELMKHRR
jgi:Protein of unknown function (DUF2800)